MKRKISISKMVMLILVLLAVSKPSQAQSEEEGTTPFVCTEMAPSTNLSDAPRGVGDKFLLWEPGQTLRVRFGGGSPNLHNKVMQYARQWEQYANLRFQVVQSGEADIRVGFIRGDGNWSSIGRRALSREQHERTMNLDIENTNEENIRRLVLHEFGLCLF